LAVSSFALLEDGCQVFLNHHLVQEDDVVLLKTSDYYYKLLMNPVLVVRPVVGPWLVLQVLYKTIPLYSLNFVSRLVLTCWELIFFVENLNTWVWIAGF